MTGKRYITAAALALVSLSVGCCRWCEHWCEHSCPPGTVGYAAPAAAPTCTCYPAPTYYQPSAPVPVQSWSQPRTMTGCTCTCP
jgi:hypothetical protein